MRLLLLLPSCLVVLLRLCRRLRSHARGWLRLCLRLMAWRLCVERSVLRGVRLLLLLVRGGTRGCRLLLVVRLGVRLPVLRRVLHRLVGLRLCAVLRLGVGWLGVVWLAGSGVRSERSRRRVATDALSRAALDACSDSGSIVGLGHGHGGRG